MLPSIGFLPNVGLGEIGIILLVVLIVMGPKRMPEVARALGKAYNTFQTESRKAQAILREGLDEVDAVRKEARAVLDDPEEPTHAHGASPPAIAPPPGPPLGPPPGHSAPAPHVHGAAPPVPPGPGVVDLPDDLRTHEDT